MQFCVEDKSNRLCCIHYEDIICEQKRTLKDEKQKGKERNKERQERRNKRKRKEIKEQ